LLTSKLKQETIANGIKNKPVVKTTPATLSDKTHNKIDKIFKHIFNLEYVRVRVSNEFPRKEILKQNLRKTNKIIKTKKDKIEITIESNKDNEAILPNKKVSKPSFVDTPSFCKTFKRTVPKAKPKEIKNAKIESELNLENLNNFCFKKSNNQINKTVEILK